MRKSRFLPVALMLCLFPAVVMAQSPTSAPSDIKEVKPAEGTTPAGTTTPTAGPTSAPAAGKPSGGLFDQNYLLFILMGLFVVMLVWSSRSRKKQEAKRKELLNALKKGDKVVTIGGIIGTVLEVREGEVTVKTDESNNVKMKFARWAIRDIGDSAKADAKSDEKKD